MLTQQLLSTHKTQALRGISAILIYVFHILCQLDISPLFNFMGGMCVAVFLIVSGYGINESYHKNKLHGFWDKRFSKVILPTFIFICCFDLVCPDESLKSCISELTYATPTYWFVFHVIKCYAAYYIARRFLGRYWIVGMSAWAVFCLNYSFCDIHLESEQAFSFFAGTLISENKERLNSLSQTTMKRWLIALFLIGLCCYIAKAFPAIHHYKNTLAYNYLLCPFRLSWALVAIAALSSLKIEQSRILAFCGKHSLEIYIAHIPLIGIIHDVHSASIFLLYSIASFSLLIFYTKHLQHKLGGAETVLIGINALFVAKYGARLTDFWPYLTFVWLLLMSLTLVHLLPWIVSKAKLSKVILFSLPVVMVGMVALQYSIDPYGIQVDRWSALHFPIQNMLHGVYPYIAQTHLGGYASPFPVWQILHIPFYLIGNVGLSFLPAMLFFLWTIYHHQGKTAFLTASLMLTMSPAVWYEIAVRSDLLTNFLLLGAVINIICSNLSLEWINKHYLKLSVLIALFASTRLLTILPFVVLFLPYYLKLKPSEMFYIPITFFAVFVSTFLPFAIWDFTAFFYHQYNPWTLQTRQGNTVDFIVYVPLAIAFAMNWKESIRKYHRNTALFVICFVLISMVHHMYESDNWDLFSSTYDITYYDAVIPFVILGAANRLARTK